MPSSSGWGDDDDAHEVTLVGQMSDEVKALRAGWRKQAPPAVVPDRPEIEVTDEEELDALFVEELLEDESDEVRPARFTLVSHGATDRGRRRKNNEDRVLSMPEHHVYAVADGMGGHASGEVAAEIALEVLERGLRTGALDGEENIFWPRAGDELARSIETANRAVFERSLTDPKLDGMGTTLTAIRFSCERGRAYMAHVGDSPCFRIRRGEAVQLTLDHTVANLLGITGPRAAHLSRAVGIEENVEVDLDIDVPEHGDYYLVTSDGLTKMLTPEEIAGVVAAHEGVERQVRALIDEANARGGRDNIGMVLVRVDPP